MSRKKEFIEFMIKAGVLTFGDFITKSGRRTPYFVNTGNYKTGSQIAQLGKFYADCIMENINSGNIDNETAVLFGPAYKGIPLSVTTAVSLADAYNRDIYYCFNRKEIKDHGEGGNLIGYKPQDGDRILIVEDVITAGTAVRECLPVLKAVADVRIEGLVVSVDRMEKGKGNSTAIREIYEEFGIQTFSIITVRDILDYLDSAEAGRIITVDKTLRHRMEEYLEKYCVR